jgi:hypothetical protein
MLDRCSTRNRSSVVNKYLVIKDVERKNKEKEKKKKKKEPRGVSNKLLRVRNAGFDCDNSRVYTPSLVMGRSSDLIRTSQSTTGQTSNLFTVNFRHNWRLYTSLDASESPSR